MEALAQTFISFRVIALGLFAVFNAISKGYGDHAVFFDQANYQGNTFTLSVSGGCYNFQRKWSDKITSVQVHSDSCMMAWDSENCSGKHIKLLPNEKETMNLMDARFDKKTKSVSLCAEISHRPAVEVGLRMWNPDRHRYIGARRGNNDGPGLFTALNRQRTELNFYEEPNFRGRVLTVISNGDCYNFKPKWINKISSLDTGGRCIMLFRSPNCDGVSATLPPEASAEFQNLDRIGFNNRIQSVRLCNCNVSSSLENDRESKDDFTIGSGQDEYRNSDSNRPPKADPPSSDSSRETSTTTDEGAKKVAISEHNKLRRRHGVPDLKWDSKMQSIAQTHAEWLVRHNKFEHSTNDDLGENIAGISTSNKIDAIKEAIRLWYSEIKNYNFDNPSKSVLGIKAGHFTQVVWKTTTHIGLGIAWNPRRQWYVIVCNYSPPGNYKGNYEKNVFPPMRKDEE